MATPKEPSEPGKSGPSMPPLPSGARDPSIGETPLITTHRQSSSAGSIVPKSQVSSSFDMDDYRRKHDDTEHAVETDGSSALAPAPVYEVRYPEPEEEPVDKTPWRRELFDDDDREATPRSPIARAIDAIRGNPRVRLIVFAAVATIIVTFVVFRESTDLSISALQKNAASYDGKTVKLRGRVGEVFQMGASYTYYLHQGKDTIVVFTRSQAPVPHDRITVTGSISTGYLEGVPRLALFETSR